MLVNEANLERVLEKNDFLIGCRDGFKEIIEPIYFDFSKPGKN